MSVRRPKWLVAAIAMIMAVGLMSACSDSAKGPPGNVAGLPITHFESGLKYTAPKPDIAVRNASDNSADRLAISAMDDLTTFWEQQFAQHFAPQQLVPLASILSYDAEGENQESACGETKELVNAFYCTLDDTIAWDRGVLLPMLLDRFGQMAVVNVLAHEFGHAIQYRLAERTGVGRNTPTIVKEQQADCFSGSYMRWIAEDRSPFFRVSTSDGLAQVLASLHFIRDEAGSSALKKGAHGSAFDRIFAFQKGFEAGSPSCADINMAEIESRITQLPFDRQDITRGDHPIDMAAISLLQQSLDQAFSQTGIALPRIVTDGSTCLGGSPSTPPASYCPGTNTVTIDMPYLTKLGQPVDTKAEMAGKKSGGLGDFAALTEIASRYTQGVQQAVGASVDNRNAGLRTACLVGSWARVASEPGSALRLSPGDLDEAVSVLLLPDSLTAADLNGVRVDSSFARVAAFRDGYVTGSKTCTNQYG